MTRSRLVSLLDFVHAATPRFARPEHLAAVAALLDRARTEPVHAVVSAPPRHGKTELLQHAVPWRLLNDPRLRVGYATYGQRFSEKRSKRMRAIAGHVGVPLDKDSQSRGDWRTGVDDGGTWATSVGGPITGEGFELLLIDDPHKDRAEAESAPLRDRVHEWFTDTAFPRLEPGGSCLVFMARWHEDDLAGRLIADGWEHVELRAIDDEGKALWPERWPAEKLEGIRETIGEYGWASLYLGQPLPRGGALFRDCYFYDQLPPYWRTGKGIDLAYTARTRADRSAAVVMLEREGAYYVVDVRTAQTQVPEFMSTLAAIDQRWPGPWHWYTSSTEAGLAHLATATAGVTVLPERAAVDKFQRAQGIAAAWNAGRVLLPRSAPWLDAFITEVCGFTGVSDRRDDQVDALSSAFARLGGAMSMRGHTTQSAPRAIRASWTGGLGGLVHGGPERQPAPRLDQGPHTLSVPRAPGEAPQRVQVNMPSSPVVTPGGPGRGWGGFF